MRIPSIAAVLALLLTQATAVAAASEGVAILVRRNAPDALEISYALPPGCTRLAFLKNGAGAGTIRSRWQSLDGATATADTLARGAATPTAPTLRFRVPVTSDKVTGYPGSFPVGEAIYAHMTNYAVGPQCGPVRYRFAAAGSIATARALFDGEAPADGDAPALLFLARRSRNGSLDYIDPALSAASAAQIHRVADDTAALLRKRLSGMEFKRPIIAAASASEPGGPNIGGNAGEILLLSLFNWPRAPQPEHTRLMTKLVAHEMSHRFQLRDAVDPYPDARLIHEGIGEFLRWRVSLEQGWLTPEQAGLEVDEALARCMLLTGERPWRVLSQREIGANWLEYSCGLPMLVYALAAREDGGSGYARIEAFYRQLGRGVQPDFAVAMECGDAAACRPAMLPALLSGPGAMRTQWVAMLDASALARRQAPRQSQLDAQTLQAITALVEEDCNSSSITPTATSVLVDTLPACRTIRLDVVVERVEGVPLFGDAATLPAMVAACRARGAVTLGMKDGSALAVPCRTPYQPLPYFYAADMQKIMQRLQP
ncbi:hypothetical protein [Massilia niabensis]|uniref:Peptidase M61 catalytic domain-containing protein n=1 Tax=Massilia niabensis TaxID=544910 RepID=A0ABW0L304_9BURK